jgi:hypothetical protein
MRMLKCRARSRGGPLDAELPSPPVMNSFMSGAGSWGRGRSWPVGGRQGLIAAVGQVSALLGLVAGGR